MLTTIRSFFWRCLGKKRRAGAIIAARTRKQNKANPPHEPASIAGLVGKP
jgi:hypothetical protein